VKGAGALPTREDAAGCGAEAAELPRDKDFESEMSEPDQAEGEQRRAEEGATAATAAEAATEQQSAKEVRPLYGEAVQLFHTRRRAMMEAADNKRAEELKLNTVLNEESKYLIPDQVEKLVSMACEVGKDPLDLIGMLDGIIEEALRSSGGQQSVGTHQTSSDMQQTSTAGARVRLYSETKARQVSTAGASAR
jgi:hypothetical protein